MLYQDAASVGSKDKQPLGVSQKTFFKQLELKILGQETCAYTF